MPNKKKRRIQHENCPHCGKRVRQLDSRKRFEHIQHCSTPQPQHTSFFHSFSVPAVIDYTPNSHIWSYCIPQDFNIAPHIPEYSGSVLSLALCKRKIRTYARLGDWVVATLSTTIHGPHNYVRHIFRITKILSIHDYYTQYDNGQRRDQIYHIVGGVLKHKNNTKIHNEKDKKKLQEKDLNPHARVLLSNQYCAIDYTISPVIDLPLSYFKKGEGEKKKPLTVRQQKILHKFMLSQSEKPICNET